MVGLDLSFSSSATKNSGGRVSLAIQVGLRNAEVQFEKFCTEIRHGDLMQGSCSDCAVTDSFLSACPLASAVAMKPPLDCTTTTRDLVSTGIILSSANEIIA